MSTNHHLTLSCGLLLALGFMGCGNDSHGPDGDDVSAPTVSHDDTSGRSQAESDAGWGTELRSDAQAERSMEGRTRTEAQGVVPPQATGSSDAASASSVEGAQEDAGLAAQAPAAQENESESSVPTEPEGVATAALSAGAWAQLADIPRARQEHSAISSDGRYIYLLGGFAADTALAVCEIDRFDTQAAAGASPWSPAYHALPAARCRHHFNAVAHAGELYVVGGKLDGNDSGKRWADKWNPKTKKWTTLADLPIEHWGGPAVIHAGFLHVISGQTGTHHYRLDLNNPGAGWSSLAQLPTRVVHAAAVSFRNSIYVVGGEGSHSHPVDQQYASVYVYDAGTNVWRKQGKSMPVPRNHIEWNSFVYRDQLWSVGGVNSAASPRGQSEIYRSTDANAWSRFSPGLPNKHVGSSAVIVGGGLYVMGGWYNTWDAKSATRHTWYLKLAE